MDYQILARVQTWGIQYPTDQGKLEKCFTLEAVSKAESGVPKMDPPPYV